MMTVTQVSKAYNVSARMLRYYEKIGLISGKHKEDYAYRVYEEDDVGRIGTIILLRKFRIPLKDIAVLLDDCDNGQKLEILEKNIRETDDEIEALKLIRDAVQRIADRLSSRPLESPYLMADSAIGDLAKDLAPVKGNIREVTSMKDVSEAFIKDMNVRTILLAPMTVAAYRAIGVEPEVDAGDVVTKFVQESGLYEKKPDARMFGFDNPNLHVLPDGTHGYEDWVTIPEDMEPPAPMVKKTFPGGLYAIYTIRFPEFEKWNDLTKWLEGNDTYEYELRGDKDAKGGCLEEHLNWVYAASLGWPDDCIDGQIDLMIPIRKK